MGEAQLTAKVAIVTGAGQSIGRAIALGLARAGAAVAVVDIVGERAKAVAAEIAAAGGQAIPVVADVANPSDVEAMAAQTLDRFGQIDVLVNNAGIFPKRTPVGELPIEEWDRVIAINLRGTFLCSKAVLPTMLSRGSGRILNIVSGLGDRPAAGASAYAASKAGMMALTKALSLEVSGSGVNVVAIAPGLTDTPLIRVAHGEQYIADVASRMPGGRLGQPEDVVDFVTFLASDASQYITGVVLYMRA